MQEIKYPTREIQSIYDTIVFVAGGISNCPDWQGAFVQSLADQSNVTFLNPRREAFDLKDESQSSLQIEWEHWGLAQSDTVIFWFPKETLCPITLLELGKMMLTDKKLVVGCHPEYARRFDVIKQLQLERPGIKVVDSLEELSIMLRNELQSRV